MQHRTTLAHNLPTAAGELIPRRLVAALASNRSEAALMLAKARTTIFRIRRSMTPLALKLLRFCREYKLDVGFALPQRPFNLVFHQEANPKERKELPMALYELFRAGYLENRKGGSGIGLPYRLTQAGFDLIYSENFNAPQQTATSNMTTQNFHFNGTAHNIQIGDNNTQQIISAVQLLAKAIDKADVSPEEKVEAKGVLAAMLNNPVISGLLAGVGVEGLKKLAGF